ncbi:MAG: DUF4298 domain-containing protein [Acetatifactor sp.]|nr:DUF4298 domain-containing protein [Acetatifactor sp.]
MNPIFSCSLCYHGILGGWMVLSGEAVTYGTGKVTVSPKFRNLSMPYDDIESVSWKRIVFPVATFSMNNSESYTFLIFNKNRFVNRFEQILRIRNMEKLYDECRNRSADNPQGGDPHEDQRYENNMRILSEYYEGSLWKEDFAADKCGKLPDDLKRGVLSEDGLCNIFERK